jgi:site-specific DNA recombinase
MDYASSKAVIYVRESEDDEGDSAAVDRQLENSLKLVADRSITLVHETLNDNDISATNGAARPGFQKLLKLVRDGDVNTIVCWHPDRLYRKLRDLLLLLDLAETAKPLTIVSVKFSDMDISTPAGEMFAIQFAAIGGYEGRHKSDRQLEAYSDLAQNRGVWHFSHRPYGYYRAPHQKYANPIVVESERPIVREAFRRYYDEGQSYYEVVKWLNESEFKSAGGSDWTITSLRTILTNPHYAGFNFYKGEPSGMGTWEAIITPDEWKRWTSKASKRQTVKSTFSRVPTSLLSGVIVCGICGGKVYRRERTNGKAEYRCIKNHVSIQCEVADKLVTDQVVGSLLLGPVSLVASDGDGNDLTTVQEALEALEKERADVIALRADRLITPAELRPELERIEAAVAEQLRISEKIHNTNAAAGIVSEILKDAKKDLFARHRVSWDDAAKASNQIRSFFDALVGTDEKPDFQKQRELVKLLLDVTLHKAGAPERVEIFHKLVPAMNDEAEIA